MGLLAFFAYSSSIASFLTAWLLSGPVAATVTVGPEPSVSTSDPSSSRRHIAVVLVKVHGADVVSLIAELRLRLPNRQIIAVPTKHQIPAGDQGFLEVRAIGTDHFELALILADGRGYFRALESTQALASRSIASVSTNLIAAIEDERILPDRKDVAMPDIEPVLEVRPSPPVSRSPPVSATPSTVVERARSPALELSPVLAPVAVLGFGPPSERAGFIALGATLGVNARWRRGWLWASEARFSGWTHERIGIVRMRFAIGGGYVVRKGAFSLVSALSLLVEPWIATEAGVVTATFDLRGQRRTMIPLLGAALRLVPSYEVSVHARRPLRFRIGAAIELAGSGVPTRAGGVVRIRDARGEAHLRAGGLELALGVELGIWIPAWEGRRRSP